MRYVCHMVRRNSSAFQFDRAEIALILTLFRRLKPLNGEGGEETGEPGENPRVSETATYKSSKIQAPTKTRTRSLALVADAC